MRKTKRKYGLKYLMNPYCKFFNGYSPCPKALENGQICPTKDCLPVGKRLLIIEMGGLGSVLRATVVAKEYKKKHKNSQVIFLTHEDGIRILKFSPHVDNSFSNNTPENFFILMAQKFDDIYNFEINQSARALTSMIASKHKYGFGMSDNGLPKLINPVSADLFRFQIDNAFRQDNKKSIQQLLIEAVGIRWENQIYDVLLNKKDLDYAKQFISKNKIKGQIVGLNIGSKKKHANKRWPIDNFIKLAKELKKISNVDPVILGGPEEKEIYDYAMSKLKQFNIVGNECNRELEEYLALISKCDVIVSATTFGLIAAIGLGVKTISICSPKPINEVYDYGNGIKITKDNKYDPRYSTKVYDISPKEELKIGLKDISVKVVLEATKDILNNDLTNPVRYILKNK